MKYSVKYDKGPKGVLSLNHICPEEPASMCDLSVGSRVVGKLLVPFRLTYFVAN